MRFTTHDSERSGDGRPAGAVASGEQDASLRAGAGWAHSGESWAAGTVSTSCWWTRRGTVGRFPAGEWRTSAVWGTRGGTVERGLVIPLGRPTRPPSIWEGVPTG